MSAGGYPVLLSGSVAGGVCDFIKLVAEPTTVSEIPACICRKLNMATTMKMPPLLEDEDAYEVWKEDLQIWCDLTDIPVEKHALAVHLTLTGRARAASQQVPREDLKKSTGVKTLLAKLDSEFLVEKGRRQFAAFNAFHNYTRTTDDIGAFVSGFENVYFKFKQQDMTLPDTVLAFMLLRASNLDEVDRKVIMSSIKEVTYANMKSSLKRVFCDDAPKSEGSSLQIKSEPVFYGNEERDQTAQQTRGGRGGRGRRQWRGVRGGRRSLTGANRTPVAARGGRRSNPQNADGEVSRCFICDSKFHWARECPDSYENSNNEVLAATEEDNEESAQLSLFVGYTGNGRSTKLKSLITEAAECAVLDSGCSNTVCGLEWYEKYISGLTDFQLNKIEETDSAATFTFGDGATISSLKKVKLPCYIDGKLADISTDVVDSAVPLLLSNKAMRKAKMCIDFGNDSVTIGKSTIKLCTSASGHYLLPLSM